jgi:hypothetical protein
MVLDRYLLWLEKDATEVAVHAVGTTTVRCFKSSVAESGVCLWKIDQGQAPLSGIRAVVVEGAVIVVLPAGG